jgi:dihydropteroate synthase
VNAVARQTRGWSVRGRVIALDRPVVIGIVNVTPDSFSDAGRYLDPYAAVAHGIQLVEEGADILDVGGESTRPQGAVEVSVQEEIKRVVPVIRQLAARGYTVSVDTTKAAVASAAITEGASIVNDVSGLRLDAEMGAACAKAGAGLVVMHSRGGVQNMATYELASYGEDVVAEVVSELEAMLRSARAAGVPDEAIVVDPGIGFAKRSEHSLAVLSGLPRVQAMGFPILVGASRKRFIGEIVHEAIPAERLYGTVGANVVALTLGARLFRVHDVRATRQALDVAWRILHGSADQ